MSAASPVASLPVHLRDLPHPELVDPRTGIVRGLRAATVPDHFPAGFDLVTATLSDTTAFAGWAADPAGAGYGFCAPQAVLGAALGEAVERYCGNAVPDDLPAGSARGLRAAGHEVLDLASLALFSAEQTSRPGFPAAALHDDLRLEWTPATDTGSGVEVLVPASLVWPSYLTTDRGQPLTHPVVQAGLAAGPTREHAVTGAVREIVERDAMTLSWYGGRGFHAVRVPAWLRDLAAGPVGALQTRFLSLHREFGVPVLAALVRDTATGYLSLGAGVADDPVDAAVKALGEALQLQLVLADHDDPGTLLGGAGDHPGSPLKPWRADRRYASSYRADRRDVVDHACHLQLHLDPAVQQEFEARLQGLLRGTTDLADLASTGDPADLLRRAGHRVLEVDLTTTDVAPLGLHVVRVLAPGTYSSAPVGLPFLGGRRLGRTAVTTTPMPH